MTQKSALLLLMVILFLNLAAQKKKIPKTTIHSSTKESIYLQKDLDSIFSTFNTSTPGIAVTVIKNSRVIAKKAYGMASLEYNIPFNHNILVRMPYSEGRIFISIAAAMMEQDRLLHLDDKVRSYFPLLPEWSEMVTIQDLLNHSTGFADEWATLALTQASMANHFDKSQFLKFLYNQPSPAVEPRKGYMYSNSDFGLLRLILEEASGENLATYMKRKIFSPLGMNNTMLHDKNEAVILNHAFIYNIDAENSYKLWLLDKTSPGGNYYILTSANDLEKWAAAHADEKSFISSAVNRLKQYARPIPVMKGINYVFGQKLRKIGDHSAIVHMGVSELPFVAYIPEKKLTVILLSNLFMPRWDRMEQVLSSALNIPIKHSIKPNPPRKPILINHEDVKPFEGTYEWSSDVTFQSQLPRRRITQFIADKIVLKVVYVIGDTLDLVPVAKNTFRDPDYPDVFIFSNPHPDSTIKATLYTSDGNIIRMEKSKTGKPKLSLTQLQKLTGKYYSRHLDFYWTLALMENNTLVVKRPTIADKILEPVSEEEFLIIMDYGPYSSEGWIRFHFKENGEVSHFTVSHPRLMHHRFDKM